MRHHIAHRPRHSQMAGFDISDVGDAFADAGEAIGDAAEDVGDAIADVATSLADSAGDAVKYVGIALSTIAPAMAFIPGIGSGIGAAMAAAGALAQGQGLDDILIAAAANAIPGGGIVNLAVRTAASSIEAVADGKDLGGVALAGARGAIEAQGGPIAAAAFDAGVAIAQGKQLQDAGFAVLAGFVKGNDAAEKAVAYGQKITSAALQGKNIAAVLEADLISDVAVAAGLGTKVQVDEAIGRIKKDASLLAAGSDALGRMLNTPEPVARAAQVIMRTGAEDVALRERMYAGAILRDLGKASYVGPGFYTGGPGNAFLLKRPTLTKSVAASASTGAGFYQGGASNALRPLLSTKSAATERVAAPVAAPAPAAEGLSPGVAVAGLLGLAAATAAGVWYATRA